MKDTFNIILLVLLIYGVFGADEDEVKSVPVMEGDSVTLNPDLTPIQKTILIVWRFKDEGPVIAQISEDKISYPSQTEIFRDRLELNQTGSLIIKNMRTKHSGLYKLMISSSGGTSNLKFSVTVYESPSVIAGAEAEMKSVSVMEGDPVTLDVPQLQGNELIVWRFGDEGKLIAKHDIEVKSPPLYETDGRFRYRLALDQTGSLIITNTRTADSGLYTVKISNNKQTLYKRFTVTVGGSHRSWVIAVICGGVVLFLVAAAVFYYCYRNSKLNKLLLEISEKLKQLPEISKQLQQLYKMPENIEQLPDVCPGELHDEKVPGKKLSEISEQLEQLSKICERELPEISKQVQQLHDKKISEQLSKISKRIKKKYMGKSPLAQVHEESGEITHVDDGDGNLQLLTMTGSETSVNTLGDVENSEQHTSVTDRIKVVSAREGESVTLNPDTEIQTGDQIQWMFGLGKSLIAEINVVDLNCSAVKSFTNRLKLDNTGSLTIEDIRTEDTGFYHLKINSSSGTTNKILCLDFYVKKISVTEGESVTLNPDPEVQTDDEILWTFGIQETRIAENRKGATGPFYTDEKRFKNTELGKTGSLTINETATEHIGIYKLQIISSRGTSYQRFVVSVKRSARKAPEMKWKKTK